MFSRLKGPTGAFLHAGHKERRYASASRILALLMFSRLKGPTGAFLHAGHKERRYASASRILALLMFSRLKGPTGAFLHAGHKERRYASASRILAYLLSLCPRKDSNLRHPAPETGALSTELRGQHQTRGSTPHTLSETPAPNPNAQPKPATVELSKDAPNIPAKGQP